jgi:hypothetical protein
MFNGLRFRPAGWLAAIGTLGAMAATMVIAAPGGAAAPEKEFTASFKQECVVGPGSLNQKGTLEVMTRSKGPESVAQGQSFESHESTSTITSPAELGNTLFSLGVRKVRGSVTNFELNGIGLSPPVLNIAKPAAFPEGLPYEAPVEQNKATSFTVPHEGSYSFGPYTVTGVSGSNAELEVNSEPGFKEVGTGEYEATGKGIVSTLEGLNETGGHVIGPLPTVCTAPKGVVLASIPIEGSSAGSSAGSTAGSTASSSTKTVERMCATRGLFIPPHPVTISPDQGPASGGTEVVITGGDLENATGVFFGGKPAASFKVETGSVPSTSATSASVSGSVSTSSSVSELARGYIRAVTPPGTGPVRVVVYLPISQAQDCREGEALGEFTYLSPTQKAQDENWVLSGSLTDKKLGQLVTLLAGATFNGSVEVNTETGAGSVSGSLAIPAFTTALKLFGVLPVELGMTLTPEGSVAGTVAKSETIPGDETLTVPVKFGMGITSVSLLGLKIPTTCATAEPLSLSLVDNLTREELLTKGWNFAGSTTIPNVKCEGGLLGGLFGAVLSALLSGPENAYAFKVTAPIA